MFVNNISPMQIENPKKFCFKQSLSREQVFSQLKEKEIFKCQEIVKTKFQKSVF